jgi:hypothetical protein
MNGMKFVDIKLVIEFMYRGEIKVWVLLITFGANRNVWKGTGHFN